MSHAVRFPLRLCPYLLALAMAAACDGDTPTAPSDTPTAPSDLSPPIRAGTVTGVVRGMVPLSNRLSRGHTPLTDVQVSVTTGRVAGLTTRTAEGGIYTLEIPGGPFNLRFAHAGYEPAESGERTTAVGGQIVMPDVILRLRHGRSPVL